MLWTFAIIVGDSPIESKDSWENEDSSEQTGNDVEDRDDESGSEYWNSSIFIISFLMFCY